VAATTSIVLIIREDPRTSARPVEALRIALGLAAGENPITVILMGQAVQLLAEETDDIVDIEILEKYLPSFEHLQIPFLLVFPSGPAPELQEGFAVTVGSSESARQAMAEADRVLVF
jgi:sulfur relay (sulfurtransferase) DsrF/TusC family protein